MKLEIIGTTSLSPMLIWITDHVSREVHIEMSKGRTLFCGPGYAVSYHAVGVEYCIEVTIDDVSLSVEFAMRFL